MEKPVVGSVVTLKKQHPCGGKQWKVIRVGADIKLECTTCNRMIFMERPDFAKMVRKVDGV